MLEQNKQSSSLSPFAASCAAIEAAPGNCLLPPTVPLADTSFLLPSLGKTNFSRSLWCGPSHLVTCESTLSPYTVVSTVWMRRDMLMVRNRIHTRPSASTSIMSTTCNAVPDMQKWTRCNLCKWAGKDQMVAPETESI